MKKVLILFGRSNWRKSKPFNNEKYMYSYEYFYEMCKKNGIQVYRASYQWYDHKKKIFKHGWIFEKSGGGWKRVNNIKPDLIFDKVKYNAHAYKMTEQIAQEYIFFNNIEFTRIVDNKLNISLIFSEWSKKSFLVETNRDLEKAIGRIDAEKIVLKPIYLSGGDSVMIGTKNEVLERIILENVKIENWIAQDFIDSSNGIPGIMRGVHDLRLVFINNEIVYAYYRQPAQGSLLANLAKGGTMKIVKTDKLPKNLKPIADHANNIFSVFNHRIYTIDVMFDQAGKPWIVELNTMPGMYFEPGQEKTRIAFYNVLKDEFLKMIDYAPLL